MATMSVSGKSTRFGNADVDGVLPSNDLLPQEQEFDIDDIDGQATDEVSYLSISSKCQFWAT